MCNDIHSAFNLFENLSIISEYLGCVTYFDLLTPRPVKLKCCRLRKPTVVEVEGECRFFVVDKEEDDKFFFAH